MPSQVRIIAGPRDRSWDRYITELVQQEGYGRERHYFGIMNQDRADAVRRGMRTAGRHLGVSVKAFWQPCTGCANGGDDCRYHVSFTAYDPAAARRYKAGQSQQQQPRNRR